MRCPDRTSRADDLRRLLELYGSAEEALAAGNYYVAVRRGDSTMEIRAAALALAGFHEAAHRLFLDLRPTRPLAVFAKALACLFVEGRHAALAVLDGSGPLAGPAAALRAILADGRVRIHFLTAWRSWLDRITAARAQGEAHGLDLQILTVSGHEGADLRLDFNGPGFLDAMARAASDGAHAATIVFDDLEVLPLDFERSPVPVIKIMIDYHHNLARMCDQLGRFHHLVAYGAETHERLFRMFGRRDPMFMRLSDMGPVKDIAGEDAGIDIFLSGALLKDYSPRREALACRCVEEIEEGRVSLADGLLPLEEYRRLIGGARMIPAMLEEGDMIPSPRFYEALNAGIAVVADDPAFFAWAYPDHADLFVDVETAFRIAREPRTARGPLRRRPPTQLDAVDQMLHLALVAPLLAPRATAVGSGSSGSGGGGGVAAIAGQSLPPASPAPWAMPGAADRPPPRLVLNSNYVRQYLVATQTYQPVLARALHLAQAAGTPLAVHDAARFLAEAAQACTHFARNGYYVQFDVELRGILERHARSGLPDGAPIARHAATADAVLLAQAALGVLEAGCSRFPASLSLAYERLWQTQRFCGEGKALGQMVASLRARRAALGYDPEQSDPGPVGAALPDRLARAILEGRIADRADLARLAEADIWRLVDLVGAACTLADGRVAEAAAEVRRVLASCPGHGPAADLFVRIWQVAPDSVFGNAGGCAFVRQALEEVLARSPARIESLAPTLIAAAIAERDVDGVRRYLSAWQRWMSKLILPDQGQAQREANVRRVAEMLAAARL